MEYNFDYNGSLQYGRFPKIREAPKGYGTDRIEETRSLCSSVRKIDRCRAWINSESLRMTVHCP
jgi:hypothetical protein